MLSTQHSIAFRAITLCGVLLMIAVAPLKGTAQEAGTTSLTRIASGTKVDNPAANRWNRVVLVAQPRLATGDVDALAAPIRKAATAFALTILATVQPVKDERGITSFKLAEVGVGHSVPVGGVQTVVTYDTVKKLGVDPGFIGRQVLSENEKNFDKAKIIVHSSSLLIFDAPGIMHRKDRHRKYTMRHLVWIDPNSGQGATVIWLLGNDSKGNMRPVNEPLRLVAPGTKEDRQIHVDGSQFTLGIPSEIAFGLDDLPPGEEIAWTSEMANLSYQSSYDAETLGQLTTALNNAINASRAKKAQ